MSEGSWSLKQISDFIFLLVKEGDSKDILKRRFKKEPAVHRMLAQLIAKIDELGYEDGVGCAFSSHRMDTIKGSDSLGLIEIRVKGTLWRVITYWDRQNKLFVMLDAFRAHEHTDMSDEIKLVKPRLDVAIKLIEEVEQA